MTTFDLEITQVQLKNHTKSHESKLRISDPEWYGILYMYRCLGPNIAAAAAAHASLAAAIVIAHVSPLSPTHHSLLPSSSHTHHCCRPCITHCCHHCCICVTVIAVAVIAACRSLLGGHHCRHCHCHHPCHCHCHCYCRHHCHCRCHCRHCQCCHRRHAG